MIMNAQKFYNELYNYAENFFIKLGFMRYKIALKEKGVQACAVTRIMNTYCNNCEFNMSKTGESCWLSKGTVRAVR